MSADLEFVDESSEIGYCRWEFNFYGDHDGSFGVEITAYNTPTSWWRSGRQIVDWKIQWHVGDDLVLSAAASNFIERCVKLKAFL